MENSWIPEGKEDVVGRALAAAFAGQALDRAEPLTGGASGARLFRLGVGGLDYVLRIEISRDAFRDPARQYACLTIAAEAGIAPQLLYSHAQDGAAITRFIAADPPTPPRSHMPEIARTIRRLHGAPLFPALTDYSEGLGKVLEYAGKSAMLSPQTRAGLDALYRQCMAAYPQHALEIVSSHNDLNPSNWLFTGERMWIVDWESAFAADRYVDLGTVANFLDLEAAASERLLALYFGAAPDLWQQDRLILARQMSRLFYAGALFLVCAQQKRDYRLSPEALAALQTRGVNGAPPSPADFEGRLRLAGAMFNEALATSGSAAFTEALARLDRSA